MLGMSVLKELEFPDGKFTLCFVGYGNAESNVLELIYNWGTTSYELGNGFGLIAIGTTDIHSAIERIRAGGGRITREPAPMKYGPTGGYGESFFRNEVPVIAFVEDPNGYRIELVERRWMTGSPESG
jgi:lactoylglutathione lyase